MFHYTLMFEFSIYFTNYFNMCSVVPEKGEVEALFPYLIIITFLFIFNSVSS